MSAIGRISFVACVLAASLSAQRPEPDAPGRSKLKVTVDKVTNTQAVLAYSAPEGTPCSVQVSLQQEPSPLVIDVDP